MFSNNSSMLFTEPGAVATGLPEPDAVATELQNQMRFERAQAG